MRAGAASALFVASALAAGTATHAGTLPAPSAPAQTSPARPSASLADHLPWRAWQRTRSGLRQLDRGDASGAAAAFDDALRLRKGDPLAAFNAGTGRLRASRPDAVAPLEQAARDAAPDLAPDAWYNLGNARLATGDAQGAIEAYVQTLRRAADRQDAKRNLELALKALAEQQKKQQQTQQAPEDRQRNEQKQGEEKQGDPQRSPGGESPEDSSPGESGQPPDADAGDPSANTTPPPPDGQPNAEPQAGAAARQPGGQSTADKSPLPGFQQQPDLDAEQAAALLRAVENRERQQRRDRALERMRSRKSEDEDW